MFGDGALTFREFAMREPLPLATIHDAVFEFLCGRKDAVLYGAHAVNAYVRESRMSPEVDIASTRAAEFAEELRAFLKDRFDIALEIRRVRGGVGYRLYQVRKPTNRHLADLRRVNDLPPAKRVRKVLVVIPPELIANRVLAYTRRCETPKGFIDWRDLGTLLLTFPDLKSEEGVVAERLRAVAAPNDVFEMWN